MSTHRVRIWSTRKRVMRGSHQKKKKGQTKKALLLTLSGGYSYPIPPSFDALFFARCYSLDFAVIKQLRRPGQCVLGQPRGPHKWHVSLAVTLMPSPSSGVVSHESLHVAIAHRRLGIVDRVPRQCRNSTRTCNSHRGSITGRSQLSTIALSDLSHTARRRHSMP